MHPRAAALLFAVLAAGCAQLSWQKPDTDPAQATRDLDQCQEKAMQSARRNSTMGTQSPVIVGTPSGPVTVMSPSYNPGGDPGAQQRILSDCMRARGYHLVREEK